MEKKRITADDFRKMKEIMDQQCVPAEERKIDWSLVPEGTKRQIVKNYKSMKFIMRIKQRHVQIYKGN